MIHFDCQPSVSRGWRDINYNSIVGCVTKVATVTACAAAIFASAYLAYQNSKQWGLMAISVGLINFCALPQLLHHANAFTLRLALVVNLISISSLSLGAISAGSLSIIRLTLVALKTVQPLQFLLSNILLKALLFTSLIGYGMPLFKETLKRAYDLFQEHQLRDCFAMLQEQFRQQSEVATSFLDIHLRKNFLLHLTLFKPNWVLEFCRMFKIAMPHDIWPMAMIALGTINIEQFGQMLADLGSLMEKLEWEPSDEMREGYYLSLKIALRSLKQEDKHEAILLLISDGPKLIPHILSQEQFLQLFTADVLSATDSEMQKFLNLIHTWRGVVDKYESFKHRLTELEEREEFIQLERRIHIQAEITEEDEQRYNQLKQKYAPLRVDVEQYYHQLHQEYPPLRADVAKIYLSKSKWRNLATLPNETINRLLEQRKDFLQILSNEDLWKEIESVYHSLFGVEQNFQKNVHARMERLNHKITLLHDHEEKEPVSAIMHLSATQGFIQKDFEILQAWWGLSSPHDLEAALAEIGLSTEKDLYTSKILRSKEEKEEKEEIRDHQSNLSKDKKKKIHDRLQEYILKAPKLKIIHHVQPKEEMDQKSVLYQITEKISQFIFYAISGGLFLVPFFMQSPLAKTSFAVGLSFFILKRFGFPGTQAIANRGSALLDELPNWRGLINRRMFLFDSQQRETLAQTFMQENGFRRIRMINQELLITFFFCRFRFLQELALADRIVNLSTLI